MDALAGAPGRFAAGYNAAYLFLVKRAGWLWKFGYAFLDLPPVFALLRPLRTAWNRRVARAFLESLAVHRPDVVLVTHFLPADVLSWARRTGRLTAPLVVVITDLYPHRFWSVDGADAIVVSAEESAQALRRRHARLAPVHVLGIPVDPAFSAPADQAGIRHRLGLSEGRMTALVTSGGTTIGQFDAVVEALAGLERAAPGRLQLLVVCGSDAAAVDRLTRRTQGGPMPVKVFGFVNTMAELMAASDLIVCKAGGLTVSESLASGLPMIIYHVIPGQEQLNAEHAAKAGAAVIATRPQDAAAAVQELAGDAARLGAMRDAVKRIRRPNAAVDVVTKVGIPLVRQREQASANE